MRWPPWPAVGSSQDTKRTQSVGPGSSRSCQVIEKMVSAEGIESALECSFNNTEGNGRGYAVRVQLVDACDYSMLLNVLPQTTSAILRVSRHPLLAALAFLLSIMFCTVCTRHLLPLWVSAHSVLRMFCRSSFSPFSRNLVSSGLTLDCHRSSDHRTACRCTRWKN